MNEQKKLDADEFIFEDDKPVFRSMIAKDVILNDNIQKDKV